MRTKQLVIAAAAVLALAACEGRIWSGDAGPDGGDGCDGGCPDGRRCVDGVCLADNDPCATVSCPPAQHCEDGVCVDPSPCDGVVCPNPGEVCQGGACVSGEQDLDGDGWFARDDCDDHDPAVHPGAAEVCNGVDDDCDPATDDGADDCPGLCCGTPPGCRECCAAGQCGAGNWACDEHACTCDGLVHEGRCIVGALCTPGEVQTERGSCGWCGTRTRSRTCGEDGQWPLFGTWSACTGEGACEPGSIQRQTESCGCTGTRSRTRTCTSSCSWPSTWSSWSACSGDVYCTDAMSGSRICPGSSGFRVCPSHPEGFQRCTCSTSATWISCDSGCLM